MPYPGGKSVHGVYHRLINQIPPHRTYLETHLGGGAFMRLKRPAEINVGVDIDPAVVRSWSGTPSIQVVEGDAIEFLRSYAFEGDEFVYADPPYLEEARRSVRSPYRYAATTAHHDALLDVLTSLPCAVMVSGYWTSMYASRLDSWRTLRFPVRTRGGVTQEEWVWMNYPEPTELHDYRYLGGDYRERERIRRRLERWRRKLEELPALERQALLCSLRAEGGQVRTPHQ